MDIRKILKESAFGPALAYRHLDPLHVGMLRKIADGRFDPHSQLSGKVEAVLDDLVQFGLLTDFDYTITPEGQKALQYADKLGGSVDRRVAQQRSENGQQQRAAAPEYFEIA